MPGQSRDPCIDPVAEGDPSGTDGGTAGTGSRGAGGYVWVPSLLKREAFRGRRSGTPRAWKSLSSES
jgi:hypothetical protein